jgi:predicted O-methyltransferase YrrM
MVVRALRSRLGLLDRLQSERRELEDAMALPCDCSQLARSVTYSDLARALRCDRIDDEWRAIEQEMAAIGITEKAGGVNPGDRRAIYYLVRYFNPHEALEIGTHIGASTVHMAAALRRAHQEDLEGSYQMTTVDVIDVNDQATAPWLQYGSTYSPAEMVKRLELENQISFVTCGSLDYLATCDERYDFIFLDGDHAATTVYNEVPNALRVLRSGGVVLLHDYFPELQPLWSNQSVIHGPWLATERLRSEGAQFEVLPLGELPWPTKLGSHRTSLALLVAA